MAKPPDTRRARNRSRINMGEDYEVEYWAKALGVTKERLVEVVDKVGDLLHAVRSALDRTR